MSEPEEPVKEERCGCCGGADIGQPSAACSAMHEDKACHRCFPPSTPVAEGEGERQLKIEQQLRYILSDTAMRDVAELKEDWARNRFAVLVAELTRLRALTSEESLREVAAELERASMGGHGHIYLYADDALRVLTEKLSGGGR